MRNYANYDKNYFHILHEALSCAVLSALNGTLEKTAKVKSRWLFNRSDILF